MTVLLSSLGSSLRALEWSPGRWTGTLLVGLACLGVDARAAEPQPRSAAGEAEPVRVAFSGLVGSPAASADLEDIGPGLDAMMDGVLDARGLHTAGRDRDLFYRETALPTIYIGGYARRSKCTAGATTTCAFKIRWEIYDVRARMVVRAITVTVSDKGESLLEAAQHAIASSLYTALSDPTFAAGIPSTMVLPPPAWDTTLPVPSCPAAPVVLPASVQGVLDSVVLVRTPEGSGSGVLVSPNGYVATVAHVVGDNPTVGIELRSGLVLQARVLRVDQASDVAILDLPGDGYACRPLTQTQAHVGQEVFLIGAPLGASYGWSISGGVTSGVREIRGRRVLQTDASVNVGNSGGPLFDSAGNILALASFKLVDDGIEGMGFGVLASDWTARLGVSPAAAGAPSPSPAEPAYAWKLVELGEPKASNER